MKVRSLCASVLLAAALGGCGGKTSLFPSHHATKTSGAPTTSSPAPSTTGSASAATTPGSGGGRGLGFPDLATKNTNRVDSNDPVADAAAVALAVFPSALPGTHPTAVALAPTDDWQAALAASSLMAPPFRAPLLLSPAAGLPAATASALKLLAPTGDKVLGGVQAVRVGDVPPLGGLNAAVLPGSNPYAAAAAIDHYEAQARGHESVNVVIASADSPTYAMPAAGWAAESGEPILYVNATGVPSATQQALLAHHHPHIYVLGPPSVISAAVVSQLSRFGTVKRVGATDPAANSVAFATYRDPACPTDQACVHIPGSFGWAIRSPGHGYVLMPDSNPLYAAAAAALSSSGGYGPQLLLDDPNTLPSAVLNYFLDYATPGYNQEGPTAAVYNHAWLIGATSQLSLTVQAQVDSLLEVVPQK